MLITCLAGPIAIGLQYFTFLKIGCDIVNQMRMEIYRKIIRLPLSWIENKDNHAEQISIKLGADMYTVNHIISRYVSHFCVAISNVISGIVLAFFFEWRIALVSLVLIPLIGVVGIIQGNMISGYL